MKKLSNNDCDHLLEKLKKLPSYHLDSKSSDLIITRAHDILKKNQVGKGWNLNIFRNSIFKYCSSALTVSFALCVIFDLFKIIFYIYK